MIAVSLLVALGNAASIVLGPVLLRSRSYRVMALVQQFSNLSVQVITWRAVKTGCWAPLPEFWIQQDWVGAKNLHF